MFLSLIPIFIKYWQFQLAVDPTYNPKASGRQVPDETQKSTFLPLTFQNRSLLEASLPGDTMLCVWEVFGRQSPVEVWCIRMGKGESTVSGVKESALNAWHAILLWSPSDGPNGTLTWSLYRINFCVLPRCLVAFLVLSLIFLRSLPLPLLCFYFVLLCLAFSCSVFVFISSSVTSRIFFFPCPFPPQLSQTLFSLRSCGNTRVGNCDGLPFFSSKRNGCQHFRSQFQTHPQPQPRLSKINRDELQVGVTITGTSAQRLFLSYWAFSH